MCIQILHDNMNAKEKILDKEYETAKNIELGGFLDKNAPKTKRNTKASVFTNLFSNVRYTYQLYRALHPEDNTTTINDITLMTIESHMLNQQYNDLGFMVGERLIILAEAQSTWSENIVVRVLLYVVQTWYKYIKIKGLDIYAEEKIQLPEPELYVIFTGTKKGYKPVKLNLKNSYSASTAR